MKNIVLTIGIITTASVLGASSVLAAGSVTPTPTPTIVVTTNNSTSGYGGVTPCQPTYGAGTDCPSQKIIIDKTVKNPDSGAYVDNLSVNDPKYAPSETVSFTLKVTNTSNEVAKNVVVEDTLPAHLTYVNGISGATYDAKTRKISFSAGDMKAGESKSYTLNAKLSDANSLPTDQGIVCELNHVKVTSNGDSDDDTAQFCIEKSVLGKTKGGLPVFPTPKTETTPPTGAGAVTLLALIPSALTGFILRRRKI